MGLFNNFFKASSQNKNIAYTPNPEIKYSWEDKSYITASDRYFSGMENIEMTWSVLYNLNCYTGERAEKFIELCQKNIKDFYTWSEIGFKYGETIPPNVPAFKRLAMIYEKRGQFEESVSICKEAIKCGAYSDGSKGGMKGRLARMIKKADRSPSEDELSILDM